jgi:hypothetical protein
MESCLLPALALSAAATATARPCRLWASFFFLLLTATAAHVFADARRPLFGPPRFAHPPPSLLLLLLLLLFASLLPTAPTK